MLSRKVFQILLNVVAILVFFERVLGKFWLSFVPLILNVAPNRIHFARTFSIMCA